MTHKRPRPGSAANTGAILKLHRHQIVLNGRGFTAITMRADADVRFSTNRFHETWHVLSDWRGARVLGRLLWGLSYQQRERTLLVIDQRHLDPNPFDAAPADPIVLLPTHLTVLTRRAARQLRQRLPLSERPEGTVRWHTHGLDLELARQRRRDAQPRRHDVHRYAPEPTGWRAVDRIGGMLVFAAAATQLRQWVTNIFDLGVWSYYGMDYTDVCRSDGEVQVFRQYRREVAIASQARQEVLSTDTSSGLDPAQLEEKVWRHAATVRDRRLPLPLKAD